MAAAPQLSGLEYLLDPSKHTTGALCVVSGDEAFLKHEVLRGLRHELLGEGDAEMSWNVFGGAQAEWPDVADAVASLSLFGSGRPVAMVEEADKFVTRCRDHLEDHVNAAGSGVVVIDVKSLPGNTRLAKAVAAKGLHIRCQAPDRGKELTKFRKDAGRWLIKRAKEVHGGQLASDAVDTLFDLLPMSLGVLDQEVARLTLVAEGGAIDAKLVQEHVGGWRVRTAWDMIDAVVEGRAADAIQQLDRLLLAGEQPIGVLAQLGSTLGKFATAAAAIEQGEAAGKRVSLSAALADAGVIRFKIADAERQLRQLGRVRARELAKWRLETDLALKSHNSPPPKARIELERLIVRLSREATPPVAANR